MASKKTRQIVVSYQAAAAALVVANNLHEGHWQLVVSFGATAAIHATINGIVTPAAVVPVLRLGLQAVETPNQLSVDAAVVNPAKRLIELVPN